MLFQLSHPINRVEPSQYLIVQSQQQGTTKKSELRPKLTIKRVESRSGVAIVNFE